MSDIRNFLIKNKKRKVDENEGYPLASAPAPSSSVKLSIPTTSLEEPVLNDLDIGIYIKKDINDETQYNLLKTQWIPSVEYNLKNDVGSAVKRAFRLEWLALYLWLSYSAAEKGPFCRICVLFRPVAHSSLLGAFIVQPCIQYNKFNKLAKSHASTQWHREPIMKSQNFIGVITGKQVSVYQSLNNAYDKVIQENRVKLRSIIASIMFCARNDLPLRGKTDQESLFTELLNFRVSSGDTILQQHLESGTKNSLYIAHQSQNQIIEPLARECTAGENIKEIKEARVFSVLADETADIAGIEQMSIGIRYLHKAQKNILKLHEEFMGFSSLSELGAQPLSKVIMKTLQDFGLDLNLLVGQGYDGCATMCGHISGVQRIIRDLYPKAMFFHCANHRLNLVINDTNAVIGIRKTVGTIKEIIKFFGDSTLRRNMVPNIPLLCETRWSAKHKAIRIFKLNFIEIMNALEKLSTSMNCQTRQKANHLYVAATSSNFVVALHIIAIYSSILQPVTNQLQGTQLNLQSLNGKIGDLVKILNCHRKKSEEEFALIFQEIQTCCDLLNIDLKLPRLVKRITHKLNQPAHSVEEYYRRSIFISYLNLSSLHH